MPGVAVPISDGQSMRLAIARVAEVFAGMTAHPDGLWTLRQDSPPTPAREVFESCVTATSSVTLWLACWDAERGLAADRHLDECADWWWDDLQIDASPFTWWWGSEEQEQEQAACLELRTWLASRAPLDDGVR